MDVSTVAALRIALTQAQVRTAITGRLLKLAQTGGGAQNATELIDQAVETALAINHAAGATTDGRLDAYA